MTRSEVKKADYREVTPYWCNRLLLYEGVNRPVKFWSFMQEFEGCFFLRTIESNLENGKITFKLFENNIMTLGYPKLTDTERILKIEHKGIEIGTGVPEWGAVKGKLYFVIKHGKIIE